LILISVSIGYAVVTSTNLGSTSRSIADVYVICGGVEPRYGRINANSLKLEVN
jgi:hypothetical protein